MISKYTSKILSIFLIVFTAYNAHGQGTEDFGNLTTGSSQYSERSWTGQDGSTWTATKSRTDETIDGNAICMNDDTSNTYVQSGTISGGIGDITISTQRKYGGGSGNLDVLINGASVGTVPYSASVQTTTISSINVTGDIVIRIDNDIGGNNGGGDDRVAVDDIIWTAYSTATAWTGDINTDWATSGNWSNGVPTSAKDVSIPDVTNAPIIGATTGASVNNLTINEPDDGLTILGGGSLIVAGTSSGNVTYTRTLGTANWYLVAPPVVGEFYDDTWVANNGIDTGGTGSNVGIALYRTDNDEWLYAQSGSSATQFIGGIGYAIKRATPGNVSVTGTMNVGDENETLTTTGQGYNLLGNPYPSYLDSAAMLLASDGSLDSQTIWLWDQSTASYDAKVRDDAFKIAPGQGFFVKSDGASGNVSILESYQSHESDTFQGPIMASPEIYLTLTDDSNTRYTRIKYNENTTAGFDNGYDGEMFGATSNAFAIYTHLVGNEQGQVGNSQGHGYAVQSLPTDNYENMIVPVGINATRGITITIEATLNNFPEGINVYLADKQENRVTLLEANTSYSTILEEDLNGVGRFYIHTTPNALSSGEVMDSIPLSIYSFDSETLHIEGVATGTAYLHLYTMLGKELLQTSFEGTGLNEILLPNHLNPGIYIVKIATTTGVTTKKIMIN